MRQHPLLVVWLIAPCLGAALPGFAAAPSTRHPSPLAGVTALEKLVTYTETKIPLGELVQKVAADTGVKLTASADVADEPVAVARYSLGSPSRGTRGASTPRSRPPSGRRCGRGGRSRPRR